VWVISPSTRPRHKSTHSRSSLIYIPRNAILIELCPTTELLLCDIGRPATAIAITNAHGKYGLSLAFCEKRCLNFGISFRLCLQSKTRHFCNWLLLFLDGDPQVCSMHITGHTYSIVLSRSPPFFSTHVPVKIQLHSEAVPPQLGQNYIWLDTVSPTTSR
jgi:hypothetical protein